MIVKVPKYKILNESFFDDIEDDIYGDNDSLNKIATTAVKEYEEKYIKPRVLNILLSWNITDNYTLTCTGLGIVVDIHGHLYLPNQKLYKYNWHEWRFGTVDGNVVYTNNNLTDWKAFPLIIRGTCYANQNKLRNFDGAPIVHKAMIANRQLTKTDYPLTQKNYDNRPHTIHENSVYVISKDKFGTLLGINESKNYCTVKLQTGRDIKCQLNDVNCLAKISDLI